MSENIRNRMTVIALVLFFSALFVWPPFDDPILVVRTVERIRGTTGLLKDKLLDWKTGQPLVKQRDILAEDDRHVVQVHEGSWYRFLIRSRFDATPPSVRENLVEETEREFPSAEGGSRKLKVRLIRYRQEIRVPHTLNLGLDLSGGTELVYRIEMVQEASAGSPAQAEDSAFKQRLAVASRTEAVVDIIKRRVDILGLKEPRIQTQGSDRILIQIPGKEKQQIEEIKKVIQTSGRLEFKIVEDNVELKKDAEHHDLPDHKWYPLEKESNNEDEPEKLLIKTRDPYEVTGGDLAAAYPTQDSNGLPAVGFRFKAGRGMRFGWMTRDNIGKRIAIILDGRVFSAPVVRSQIDDVGIIEGGAKGFTYQEAKNLATILSAGSLPADLKQEREEEVSPFIGDDSIRSGFQAILLGGLLVFVFMILYYFVGGMVTDLALAFNILILLASVAVFHATLTLPGIAGILLTVGMAVDANVLVFERMREELGKRATTFQALEAGYERAFLTIFDSNLTTIITAVILIYLGTGPVRGFGITLTLGILASLFTGVYVTRTLLTWMMEKNVLKEIRMIRMAFIQDVQFDFLRWGKAAIIASTTVILAGLVFFFARGGDNFDIDFKGGYLIHIKLREPRTTEDIRRIVGKADLRKPEVQQYGPSTPRGVTDFIIRTEKDYGFDFEKMPERSADSRITATLSFRDRVDARIVRDRLSESFNGVKADAVEKSDGKRVSVSFRDEGQDLDETRRHIRRVIEAMPKWDLLNVPELREVLLPEAVQVAGDAMKVNLMEAASPDALQKKLQDYGFMGFEVRGDPATGKDGGFSSLEVRGDPERFRDLEDVVRNKCGLELAEPFPRYTQIGTAVAGDLQWKAIAALILSWVAILIYVGIRFHGIKYGVAAIVALVHDALFTIIALSVADYFGLVDGKINLTMIAAVLTIIGYSVNDTIVIFDRVRENVQANNRPSEFVRLVNLSNNQMLGRTILTNGVTLLSVLALFLWGGGVINGFAFALLAGMVSGTYSTIFVACPVIAWWDRFFKTPETAS
ncbi:MAG: protein translocase subunit SecD [Planctomycetes bacterium]|nr:protein translocase subunit SecD [Planctomycetota bacterium]